jgi:hypothetical protein
MRYSSRTIPWQGEIFHFERLPRDATGDFVWAVTRRGEFIGTMPAVANETTRDFDVRSIGWVAELLRA